MLILNIFPSVNSHKKKKCKENIREDFTVYEALILAARQQVKDLFMFPLQFEAPIHSRGVSFIISHYFYDFNQFL